MRSSSTEHPSTGEPELGSSVGIEKDHRSRCGETFSNSNVQMETTTGKTKRDKLTSKAQQEEEEERGKIIINFYLYVTVFINCSHS